jgi:hypothetical protein
MFHSLTASASLKRGDFSSSDNLISLGSLNRPKPKIIDQIKLGKIHLSILSILQNPTKSENLEPTGKKLNESQYVSLEI